jgi:hypothetical protein
VDQEQARVEFCLADFARTVDITNGIRLVHKTTERFGSSQDVSCCIIAKQTDETDKMMVVRIIRFWICIQYHPKTRGDDRKGEIIINMDELISVCTF